MKNILPLSILLTVCLLGSTSISLAMEGVPSSLVVKEMNKEEIAHYAEIFTEALFRDNPELNPDEHKEGIKGDIVNGYLDLTGLQITTLPREVGNLINVKEMYLKDNQLTTLPPEIGYLSNLTVLDIQENALTELPKEIGNLSKLAHLYLTYNQLSSIPKEIGTLTNLEILEVSYNLLTLVPKEIGNLNNLTQLFLNDNRLTSLPIEIFNLNSTLQHIDLNDNALQRTSAIGYEELQYYYGGRLAFTYKMPSYTTMESVYAALDKQSPRIQRDAFSRAQTPEIPGETIEDGIKFIEELYVLLTQINFSDETKEDYLSFELLSGSEVQEDLPNVEKVFNYLIPRLTGYIKSLYGMELDEGEDKGWQIYDESKPALKKAFSFILTSLMSMEDSALRSQYFTLWVDGMLHCPTGIKEGVDTVVLSLLGKKQISSSLPEIVEQIIALNKNIYFKKAILTHGAENTQNVHLISSYGERLRDILGLSNILEFEEKIGIMGVDVFNNNANNVLQVLYELISPSELTSWLMAKVQPQDFLEMKEELAQKIEQLDKLDLPTRLRNLEARSTDEAILKSWRESLRSNQVHLEKLQELGEKASIEDIEDTKEQIQMLQNKLESPRALTQQKTVLQMQLRSLQTLAEKQAAEGGMAAEEMSQIKSEIYEIKAKLRGFNMAYPITLGILIGYLNDQGRTDEDGWWHAYFTQDPMMSATSTLTVNGAMQLLIDLGYVIR